MLLNIYFAAREWWATLPDRTRAAWKWDLASGLFAGLYQGCIWTFVYRIARADLHATGAQMGWIIAAPAIGFIFATFWARQMDGKNKMPFCYLTWYVARGLYLFTPFLRTREQFVALVCFTPLLFSISTPAYTAIMKEIYPDAQRGRLMSAVRAGVSLTTLLTALVVGHWLDTWLDWHTAFSVGGGFGIASAWCFSHIKLPSTPVSSEPRATTAAFFRDTLDILWRNPGYRWFTASVFVSGFGNLIGTTLMPIYQVDRFHVTNGQVAILQNVGALATIAGYIFWGGFLDRKGSLAAVLLALGFNVVVPLLYAGAWGMSALYLAAAAYGLAMAGVELGYLNTTLLFSEPGKVSQYQALHSSFFGVRGSIAPHAAIPLMAALGARGAFLVSFVILMAGVGLQMISMRDYRRQAVEERLEARRAREAAAVD